MIKKLLASFALCALALPSLSRATPTLDFNGDGISDFPMVSVENDSSLTWKFYSPFDGTTEVATSFSLGVSGNHVGVGNWSNTTAAEVAVLSTSGRNVVWTIRKTDGSIGSFVFGRTNSALLSGGDFDGDGYADAALAQIAKDGSYRWQVKYNPMVNSAVAAATARRARARARAGLRSTRITGTVKFARAGEAVFFVKADSQGDSFASLRQDGKSSTLLLFNPRTRQRRTVRLKGYEFTGTAPFVVQRDSGLDILALATKGSSSTTFQFRGVRGENLGQATIQGAGDIIVGDFAPSWGGDEIAVQNSTTYTVHNPFNGQSYTLPNVNGIPIDDANINYFSGNISACRATSPFSSSYIYKTFGSKHFSNIDPRKKSIGFLVKPNTSGSFPSCITAIDTLGNEVAKLGLFAKGSGWTARYYAGVGCGNRTPYGGAKVAALARASSGSSRIYFRIDGRCIGPIAAENCVNSSSC